MCKSTVPSDVTEGKICQYQVFEMVKGKIFECQLSDAMKSKTCIS